MLSLSKQAGQIQHSIKYHTKKLWSAQDARALGYYSSLRALIQSLLKNGSENKDSLLRLFSFCRFKRVWPVGETFLSLNHSLIKEIVSCRKKTNTSSKQHTLQLQVTIQLFQANRLTGQWLSLKNQIQQWDQDALQEINYLLCFVHSGSFSFCFVHIFCCSKIIDIFISIKILIE